MWGKNWSRKNGGTFSGGSPPSEEVLECFANINEMHIQTDEVPTNIKARKCPSLSAAISKVTKDPDHQQ